MCPLWPAHYLLMYIFVMGPLWLLSFRMLGVAADAATSSNFKWDVTFNPTNVSKLKVEDVQPVQIIFNRTELIAEGGEILIEYIVDHDNIAYASPLRVQLKPEEIQELEDKDAYPSFNLTGKFLGYTKVHVERTNLKNNLTYVSDRFNVTVLREKGALDKAFTYSVAGLVGIIYINMGAALDTKIVTETMKRPIGPAIGFFSQFVIMPMLAYGIAKWLIPVPSLQLGLFITGCSPGGGASNIWTLTLGGNLDLSITMTTVSTFSAFFMMPLWILTLGATIMEDANLTIPYTNIASFAVVLVVPLIIGIVIQRTLPKAGKFLVRILKPFAILLIIFIVVFAIYTNTFLFKLFTWEIIVSGILLPWLGYLLGGGAAYLMKQDWRDIIAIAIETGVQNTGLAILALRFSLPSPENDLTTVLPVAVAIMTPVIPALILLIQKITGFKVKEPKKEPLFATPSDELSQQAQKTSPSIPPPSYGTTETATAAA